MANNYSYVDLGDLVIRTTTPEFHPSGKVLPKAEGERRYKAEAEKDLLKLFAQTTTVYCILRHVSASGMRREITLVVCIDNEPRYISHDVCTLLGERQGKRDGVIVNGCGMDMGFDLVHRLQTKLGLTKLNHRWL